jgi:hypothetical protein
MRVLAHTLGASLAGMRFARERFGAGQTYFTISETVWAS